MNPWTQCMHDAMTYRPWFAFLFFPRCVSLWLTKRHAAWRHDHDLSQTASTWTSRRWSRSGQMTRIFSLVGRGEPLTPIGRNETSPHDRRSHIHTTHITPGTTTPSCSLLWPEKGFITILVGQRVPSFLFPLFFRELKNWFSCCFGERTRDIQPTTLQFFYFFPIPRSLNIFNRKYYKDNHCLKVLLTSNIHVELWAFSFGKIL